MSGIEIDAERLEPGESLECDDCGDAYDRDAVRSYMREVSVPGGTQYLCLSCIEDRRRVPAISGAIRPTPEAWHRAVVRYFDALDELSDAVESKREHREAERALRVLVHGET